jgi:hypothetical protein
MEFGMTHTALQMGPIILEWNDSGLVNIRALKKSRPKNALFALDLFGSLKNFAFDFSADYISKVLVYIETVINNSCKLCNVIVYYNVNMTYDQIKCNCQTFTTDALAALGVKPLQKYLGPYTCIIPIFVISYKCDSSISGLS